jgi:hypothetical protein
VQQQARFPRSQNKTLPIPTSAGSGSGKRGENWRSLKDYRSFFKI